MSNNGSTTKPSIHSEVKHVRGTTAVPLGRGVEPGPPLWIVAELFIRGHLNLLYGDGGVGKSFVALYLAMCVALGKPFFEKAVLKGRVMWIDAEGLGEEEMNRRAFQIARGIGLDEAPEGIFYYQPKKQLTSSETESEVRENVQKLDIDLIVLDSLSLGAAGTDVSDQKQMVQLLQAIQRWGVTVIALDHIAKASRGNDKSAQAFGSVMKRNKARSSCRLFREDKDKDTLILEQEKSNFGPLQPKMEYDMRFLEEAGRVTVEFEPTMWYDCSVEELIRGIPEPSKAAMSVAELVLMAVQELYEETGEPVEAGQVATRLDINRPHASNILGSLTTGGKLKRVGRGKYAPTEAAA